MLKQPLEIDGLRLLSKPNIGAMKNELMALYNQKYSDGPEMMIVRSLSYFDDADTDEEVVFIKNFSCSWKGIKTEILKQIKLHYL